MKQDKKFSRQGRRLSALIMLAIASGIAVLATGSEALAQIDGITPGAPERVGGSQLRLQGSFNEARAGGHLVEVWRAADSNGVFIAIDNGSPFTYLNALTTVNPTVVATGNSSFMVIFVGTNNQINWGVFNLAGNGLGPWRQIPGQTTTRSVNAVQAGTSDSDQVLLVYHGEGGDNRPFSTFFNGSSWTDATVMQNGRVLTEPSVAFDPILGRFIAAAQGLNGTVWLTIQNFGSSQWAPWHDTGQAAVAAPSIVYAAGTAFVAYVNPGDGAVRFIQINNNLAIVEGPVTNQWQPHITGTDNVTLDPPVMLTPVGNQVYALYDFNGFGYNKRIF